MKKSLKFITAIAAVAFTMSASARGGHHSATPSHGTGAKSGSTPVSGYTKKDGTYVQGHGRSKADGSFENNWSTKGNTNPETGKDGSQVTAPVKR